MRHVRDMNETERAEALAAIKRGPTPGARTLLPDGICVGNPSLVD
jgi:hypothetical protein